MHGLKLLFKAGEYVCLGHMRMRVQTKSWEEALGVALSRKHHVVLGRRSLQLSRKLHTTAGKTHLG